MQNNFSSKTLGLLTVSLILVLAHASGSLVEESTGGVVTYQFDAGSHSDAADLCADAAAEHALPLNNRTDGWMVLGDDEADHFVLHVQASEVGQRLLVDAVVAQVEYELVLDVLAPGCLGSVLDDENQPKPHPSDPVPQQGEHLATAKNVDGDYSCSDRWFLNMNQVNDLEVPESIHVTWTDGSQEDVPPVKSTPATVVHYATTSNPGFTVHSATAVMPDEWTGQLILSEGFCDAVDGEAVFGDESQRLGDTAIEFTPITSGPHIVSVVMVRPTVDVDLGPRTMSCHACVEGVGGAAEPLFYALGGATL